MGRIESVLIKEEQQLERIVEQSRKRIQGAPKGYVRITKKQAGVEYYYKCADRRSGNGRYMRKSEINLVKGLVQREYDERIVKLAEERIRVINTFLDKYKETSLEKVYQKTNGYRRALITDPIIADEEYIKEWQSVEYVGKAFAEDAPEIITERGERVRSKSEKIIADKLYALGVPYRYECPLILEGNVRVYPDFTILKMPEREEVYLEHFGMMDDNDYVNGTLHKLKTYERNGIYLGVHLFMTYETNREPLNTRALDRLIRKLWCSEA